MQRHTFVDLRDAVASVALDAAAVDLPSADSCAVSLTQMLKRGGQELESWAWRLDVDAVLAGGAVANVGTLRPIPPSAEYFYETSTPDREELDTSKLVGIARCPGALAWRVTASPEFKAWLEEWPTDRGDFGRLEISIGQHGASGMALEHERITRVRTIAGTGNGLLPVRPGIRLLGWTAVGDTGGGTVSSDTWCPINGAGITVPDGVALSESYAPHTMIGRLNNAGTPAVVLRFTNCSSWAVELGA
jgi:hypothetical protein